MTQMPCKYCDDHQQILYDKYAPEGKKTTNLDGTHHTHNKQQQQQQTKPLIENSDSSLIFKNNEELAKYTYAARQEGIQQAHKENMEASERLAKSIDNLIAKLDEIIQAYLAHGSG